MTIILFTKILKNDAQKVHLLDKILHTKGKELTAKY